MYLPQLYVLRSIRGARNWYNKLTESIVDQFPYLLAHMTRDEAIVSIEILHA